MLEAATSDLTDPDARAALPQGRRPPRPLLVHDQHGPPLHGGPRRARAALPAARGPRSSRSSSATASASALGNACDYDDLLLLVEAAARRGAGGGGAARGLLRPRPRRRVPGHQPAPGRHRGRHGEGQEERHGRRRRRAGDLLVPRRVVREHPRLPGALPRREDLPPDAQLPLDARDPGARQRLDRAQRSASSRRSSRRAARGGPLPAVVPLADVPEQARFVGQRLLEWHDEGEKLADLAVLYRAHYQALELQIELTRRGIPYEIRSGTRFFEQRHVKDVLAFLRIVVNPEGRALLEAGAEDLPARRGALGLGGLGGDRGAPGPARRLPRARRPGADLGRGRGGGAEAVPLAARRASTRRRSAPRPAEAIRSVVEERLPRLRAREVPQRRRPPGRPRAVRPVRADLRLAARLPRGGHALQRALGRGRRGGGAGRRPRRALLDPPGQGARVEPRHRDGPLGGALPELPLGRRPRRASRRSGGSSTSP